MADLQDSTKFDTDIIKLIKLMDTDNLMMQMLEVGLQAGLAELEGEDDDFPSEVFIEKIKQKVDIEIMLYQMVPLYKRHYTPEDIAGLLVFYETPLGRKLIKNAAQITQEIIAANQTWIDPLVETIANDLDSMA